jgi:hypothetical protein
MLRNLAQKIAVLPLRLTRLVPNPGKQQLGCLQNLSVGYSQVQRDTVLTKSVVPKTSATCLDWSSQWLPRCHHAAGQIGIPSTVEALLQKLLSTVSYSNVGDSSSTLIPCSASLHIGQRVLSSTPRYPSLPRFAEGRDCRSYFSAGG